MLPPPLLSAPTHREGVALGVPAAALTPGHTLPSTEHVAGLTDTALLAGGGNSGAFALAFRVPAGRRAGGNAGGVDAVGGAVQSWRWAGGGTLTERGLCAGSKDREEQERFSPLGVGIRGQPAAAAA